MDELFLSIYVQPNARDLKVVGFHQHYLKIRIPWKPQDGAANKGLVKAVGGFLSCPIRSVSIVQGQKSRYKVLRVHGVSQSFVDPILKEWVRKIDHHCL